MTAEDLKDDIAWDYGAIAGAMNLHQLDDEYLQWLVHELLARWELLAVAVAGETASTGL